MLLDVVYVVDNVLPPFQGEKRVVFFTILAVTRMVIWMMRNKGLYDDANFSHRDLAFSKRWVNAASLVVRKGTMLESSFRPLPAHGVYGKGP